MRSICVSLLFAIQINTAITQFQGRSVVLIKFEGYELLAARDAEMTLTIWTLLRPS